MKRSLPDPARAAARSFPARTKKTERRAHIFIDLDGVLADFDTHALNEGKYAADGKVKWNELDYKWWSSMPPCDGAKEFYDAACKLGPVKFLTAPVLSEGCFSGKAAWVQSFVPERGREALKDLIICPGADKYFIAAPGRILIDDREKNVREWSAAGGISIHHKGDFAETLEALRKAVAALDAPSQKPRAAKRSNAPRQ